MRQRVRLPVLKAALSALLLSVLGVVAVGAAVADERDGGKKGVTKTILATDWDGEIRREVYVDGPAGKEKTPLISFIDSPSAVCQQPDPRKDDCYINWYYLYVDATPNYMIDMSLILNVQGVVARVQGFFQTSMYVPGSALGLGFRVQCGPPQFEDPINPCPNPPAGCVPVMLGRQYSYTIRARASDGLKSANYGTVSCPAYLGARFYSLRPCRVLDTRTTPDGPLEGPALRPSARRTFKVSAAGCGIPSGAWAVSVNASVTAPSALGYLTLHPGGTSAPLASTINFSPGQTRSNNAVVPLDPNFGGTIDVTNGSSGPVHFILDVNGYFQ